MKVIEKGMEDEWVLEMREWREEEHMLSYETPSPPLPNLLKQHPPPLLSSLSFLLLRPLFHFLY